MTLHRIARSFAIAALLLRAVAPQAYLYGATTGEKMRDARETKLARMTILALSAATSADASPSRFRLDDSPGTLTEEEAIEHLVRMPKPVECTATASARELTIRCTAVTNGESTLRYEYQMHQLRAGTGLLGAIVQELERGSGREILLAGGGRSIPCRASEIRSWQEQYVIRAALSIVAERELNAPGANAPVSVLKVGPSRAESFISDSTLEP